MAWYIDAGIIGIIIIIFITIVLVLIYGINISALNTYPPFETPEAPFSYGFACVSNDDCLSGLVCDVERSICRTGPNIICNASEECAIYYDEDTDTTIELYCAGICIPTTMKSGFEATNPGGYPCPCPLNFTCKVNDELSNVDGLRICMGQEGANCADDDGIGQDKFCLSNVCGTNFKCLGLRPNGMLCDKPDNEILKEECLSTFCVSGYTGDVDPGPDKYVYTCQNDPTTSTFSLFSACGDPDPDNNAWNIGFNDCGVNDGTNLICKSGICIPADQGVGASCGKVGICSNQLACYSSNSNANCNLGLVGQDCNDPNICACNTNCPYSSCACNIPMYNTRLNSSTNPVSCAGGLGKFTSTDGNTVVCASNADIMCDSTYAGACVNGKTCTTSGNTNNGLTSYKISQNTDSFILSDDPYSIQEAVDFNLLKYGDTFSATTVYQIINIGDKIYAVTDQGLLLQDPISSGGRWNMVTSNVSNNSHKYTSKNGITWFFNYTLYAMANSYDPVYNPNGLTLGLFFSQNSGYCLTSGCSSPTSVIGNSYVIWIFNRNNNTFFNSDGLFNPYNPIINPLVDGGVCNGTNVDYGTVIDCYNNLMGTQYYVDCTVGAVPSPIGKSLPNYQISFDVTHSSKEGLNEESSTFIWIRNNSAGITCGSGYNGVYIHSTKMPKTPSIANNNYNLSAPNHQLYVYTSWGNLGYGGDKLTWSDYFYNATPIGNRLIISPKFYFDYKPTNEFNECEILDSSSNQVHYVDYVNIAYVANILACASSICSSGVGGCSSNTTSSNIFTTRDTPNILSRNNDPISEMNSFMRRTLAITSTSNPGTTCSCGSGLTCPKSGSVDGEGIYGNRIIFTGTYAPNQPICVGDGSSQNCSCECRKQLSLVYPSFTTSGTDRQYNVSSFSIYSRQDSCKGSSCVGYSEDFEDTLCGGFLGTRMLYTYSNDSDIQNGVNNLSTSNYGVRYMQAGTDYNMFGNVNGYLAPKTLITDITNLSTNNGMYVYNNTVCK